MKPPSTGIIILPMLFGLSIAHTKLKRLLIRQGYQVELIDIYKGQPFKQPFFLKVIARNEKRNVDALASKFKDSIVQDQIEEAITRLKKADCTSLFIFGSSIGATFALDYMNAHPQAVNGLIAWYPNLIFPDKFTGPDGTLKNPPRLQEIQDPVHIFMGRKDTKLHPDTLPLLQTLAEQKENITLELYDQTDHAFMEMSIQYFFPNPLHKKRESKHSLNSALTIIKSHQSS